jgi:hypothetical protein
MGSCLIQQLFRQKIGQELDQGIVDEVLFPILRSRRHPSKELLQDIKLTQSFNEHGHSAIVICRSNEYEEGDGWAEPIWTNIPVFTPYLYVKRPHNKVMRKFKSHFQWGLIDILNEMRELNHPKIGYHEGWAPEDPQDSPDGEFDDAYIRLEEANPSSTLRVTLECWMRIDLEFLNNYLEDALVNGKRLSWGGDPSVRDTCYPVLSTHY